MLPARGAASGPFVLTCLLLAMPLPVAAPRRPGVGRFQANCCGPAAGPHLQVASRLHNPDCLRRSGLPSLSLSCGDLRLDGARATEGADPPTRWEPGTGERPRPRASRGQRSRPRPRADWGRGTGTGTRAGVSAPWMGRSESPGPSKFSRRPCPPPAGPSFRPMPGAALRWRADGPEGPN